MHTTPLSPQDQGFSIKSSIDNQLTIFLTADMATGKPFCLAYPRALWINDGLVGITQLFRGNLIDTGINLSIPTINAAIEAVLWDLVIAVGHAQSQERGPYALG